MASKIKSFGGGGRVSAPNVSVDFLNSISNDLNAYQSRIDADKDRQLKADRAAVLDKRYEDGLTENRNRYETGLEIQAQNKANEAAQRLIMNQANADKVALEADRFKIKEDKAKATNNAINDLYSDVSVPDGVDAGKYVGAMVNKQVLDANAKKVSDEANNRVVLKDIHSQIGNINPLGTTVNNQKAIDNVEKRKNGLAATLGQYNTAIANEADPVTKATLIANQANIQNQFDALKTVEPTFNKKSVKETIREKMNIINKSSLTPEAKDAEVKRLQTEIKLLGKDGSGLTAGEILNQNNKVKKENKELGSAIEMYKKSFGDKDYARLTKEHPNLVAEDLQKLVKNKSKFKNMTNKKFEGEIYKLVENRNDTDSNTRLDIQNFMNSDVYSSYKKAGQLDSLYNKLKFEYSDQGTQFYKNLITGGSPMGDAAGYIKPYKK